MNFAAVLEKLIAGGSLREEEALQAMREILAGGVPAVQIAAFLAALRAKGETAEEIAGFVRAMRATMTPVSSSASVVLDTCGTGGDNKGTFNISTAAAFTAAACGVTVAKHGNRSISSACGSADVLEAAGVKVDVPRETAERCLESVGIAFLFAPRYHPAMKVVTPVRRELGVRTVFNFLGPLANPAGANAQVIGVPRADLLPLFAKILLKLGTQGCAVVVHEAGYDEIVLSGRAQVREVYHGRISSKTLSPADFGLKKIHPNLLCGGDAKYNAQVLRQILSGDGHPLEDVVVANAALAVSCARKAERFKGKGPEVPSLREAAGLARKALRDGAALKKLDELAWESGKA